MDNYGGYLGVLRWSLAQQDDGTTPSSARPMSDEDRKFLDGALKAMTLDIPQQMRLALSALGVDDSEAEGESADEVTKGKVDALEKLFEFCEDLDMAKDLMKMDGLPTLLQALRHRGARVRALAAQVIGGCAQNEPAVQDRMVAEAVVETLCTAWDAEGDAEARRKIFFALSAVVRGHDGAVAKFLEAGGAARVAAAAADDDGRVRRKALFLGRALCARAGATAARHLLDAGALAPALAAAAAPDDEAEQGLRLVDRLVRGWPECAAAVDEGKLRGAAAEFRRRTIADAIEDGDTQAEAEGSDDVRFADELLVTLAAAKRGELSAAGADAPPAGEAHLQSVAGDAGAGAGAGTRAGAAGGSAPLLLGP